MSIKNQPHTPLPWVCHEQGEANEFVMLSADKTKWVFSFRQNGEMLDPWQRQNIYYMTHAAIAYPKLVAILQRAAFDENYEAQDCVDLLRDLGEL